MNPALSGLPPFLAKNSGLNSGFMIAQVTSAALVAESRVLSHPASVDSIPSSAGREDHVSMGMTAALKARQVVEFARTLPGGRGAGRRAGARLPAAAPCRARAWRRPTRRVRESVPTLEEDREIHRDIEAVSALIDSGALLAAAHAA